MEMSWELIDPIAHTCFGVRISMFRVPKHFRRRFSLGNNSEGLRWGPCLTSWCERKGAMNGAGGNLKSLYHRELRSYPQVSKYILVDIIFDFEGLDMFGPFSQRIGD